MTKPLTDVLAEALRCLQAAVVGHINGIPSDLKEQLTHATAALARYEAEKSRKDAGWTLEPEDFEERPPKADPQPAPSRATPEAFERLEQQAASARDGIARAAQVEAELDALLQPAPLCPLCGDSGYASGNTLRPCPTCKPTGGTP